MERRHTLAAEVPASPPRSSPDNHEVGKKRKWQRRGTGGSFRKRWAETSSPASWSERQSLQKTRATSTDSVITGDVNRHVGKEGRDWNAGSNPVSIIQNSRADPVSWVPTHSSASFPYYWGAGPGQPIRRYLESVLKSQSF